MLVLSAWLVAGAAWAAPATFDFEADDASAGWTASGSSASLTITHDTPQVRRGKGALLCSYAGAPGAPFSLTRTDLDLAGARSLAVSLRASQQTPFVLRLSEKDGAAYQLFVTCLPGEWCDLSAPLTDWQLEETSTDADGRLDAEQITTLTLQSLANLPGGLADVLGVQTGPQTLLVDDLAFRATEAPSRSTVEKGKIIAARFALPALSLLPVGGAELTRVPGPAGGAPSAIGVRYSFTPYGARAWPGLVVPVGHLRLDQAASIRLRLRSLGPLRFSVLAEEQEGERFEARGELPTGGEWLAKDFRLADLKPDLTRPAGNGVLDAGRLRVIVIVADVFNTLLDEKARSEFALDELLFLTP